jgi:solute carrier family 25 folate transporter 32
MSNEILSGLTAGFITTSITHPLDLLKIRLQLDTSNRTFMQSSNTIISQLIRHDPLSTLKELYRGIIPNLVGSSLAWGIYFASYRQAKDLFHTATTMNKDSNLKSWQYLGAGFTAGGFTALVTNPIWVLKTRILSTSKEQQGAYKGLVDGVIRIAKEEGIKGFYRGLVPSLLGVSQGALQFTIYDTLKYHFLGHDERVAGFTISEYLTISSVSKILALVMLYPCQLTRSRLQSYDANMKFSTVIKEIYMKEGLGGFWKGVWLNIVRVLPATCITFVVYEKMNK